MLLLSGSEKTFVTAIKQA